jgi:hypothetical protein
VSAVNRFVAKKEPYDYLDPLAIPATHSGTYGNKRVSSLEN